MRTMKTEQEYLKRAGDLILQAQAYYPNSLISDRDFVDWLILEKKPNISKSTWRQYKAAVIYYLNKKIQDDKGSYEINAIISKLDQTTSEGCKKKGQATSANKQKKINDSELTHLIEYSSKKRSRHGINAVVWLLAGLATGLRPSEWQHAEINNSNQLIVINGKATNGRAHGEKRTINLTLLTKHDKQVIEQHLAFINVANAAEAEGFNLYYSHCRSALYELTRTLWPKRKQHITLYSARHQFAANAKQGGLSLEVIAALMGHASTDTATMHYGRRVSGKPNGIGVRASNEDIERVRVLNLHRNESSLRSAL